MRAPARDLSYLLMISAASVCLAASAPCAGGTGDDPARAAAPRPPDIRSIKQPWRVLMGTRFPGWQAWNVSGPFALRDAHTGESRLYYAGTSTSRLNASIWDDWVIGVVRSTDERSWHPPDEYEPVLLARRSLEGDVLDPDELAGTFDSVAASDPCVVRVGDGSYRMWYTGWNGESEHVGGGLDRMVHQRIGLARSPDGLEWMKQRGDAEAGAVLGLGGAGAPDGVSLSDPHVLRVGDGFRLWYEGFDGRTWRVLSAASPDGLTWTKEGVVVDLGAAGSLDALGARHPMVIERRGLLEMWYQGLSEGRARTRHVLRATSTDGRQWVKLPHAVDLWSGKRSDTDDVIGSILINPDGELRVFFSSRRPVPDPSAWRVGLGCTTILVVRVLP